MYILLSLPLPSSPGKISTEPSVSEVKQLLLCPLHMIAQSLNSCVQPLTGVEPSGPASHATSTVVNNTEASTPMPVESSPVKKSLEVKQKVTSRSKKLFRW